MSDQEKHNFIIPLSRMEVLHGFQVDARRLLGLSVLRGITDRRNPEGYVEQL
jgi:hypothetical protein